MTDDKKTMHGEVPPEQEDALEDVTGGKVEFETPVFDPGYSTITCPACGADIDYDNLNRPNRVYCSACGRWFHYEENTLVEG